MKILINKGFNRFLSNNVKRSHRRTIVKKPTYPKIPAGSTKTVTSSSISSEASKISNTSSNIKTFDWFKKINEVSAIDSEKRFEAILKQLLNFTSMDKIEELKPSFEVYFKQRLLTFGDLNIPLKSEDVEEDQRVAKYREVIEQLVDKDVGKREHRGRDERPGFGVKLSKVLRSEGEAQNTLVAAFEREWELLSKPRLANVSRESFELLEKVILESPIKVSVCQEYIEELRGCQYDVSTKEVNKYLRLQCGGGVSKAKFQEVTQFVNLHKLPLNDESYLILLNGLLENDEYQLYYELVENFNKQGLRPNRGHLRSLQDYFTLVGDFGKILNVLELQINDYKMNINEQDTESIIKNLNVLGKRSLSMDVLNILLSIRQRFELVHGALSTPSSTVARTQEAAYIIADAVSVSAQQLIEYVPVVTGQMFKWQLLTSGTFDDVVELAADLKEFTVALDVDTLKAVLVTLKLFQQEGYLFTLLSELEHSGILAVLARGLAQDREFVELVVDVLQRSGREGVSNVVQSLQQGDEVERSLQLLKLLI